MGWNESGSTSLTSPVVALETQRLSRVDAIRSIESPVSAWSRAAVFGSTWTSIPSLSAIQTALPRKVELYLMIPGDVGSSTNSWLVAGCTLNIILSASTQAEPEPVSTDEALEYETSNRVERTSLCRGSTWMRSGGRRTQTPPSPAAMTLSR
jgi:hypothetical protein